MDSDFGDFFLRQTYLIGFKPNEFKILIWSIIILAATEVIHKKKSLIKRISGRGIVFRWGVYLLILFLLNYYFSVFGDASAHILISGLQVFSKILYYCFSEN